MTCSNPFTPILARLRSIGGRSKRIERKLDLLIANQTRMENMMTSTKAELLTEIQAVKDEVAALLKRKDADIAAAVEQAKAAWQADNEDEHAAAMAALEEVRKSLAETPFSPSGN